MVTDPALAGPLGGLWLSAVRTDAPTLLVRAALWWRDLERLGVHVPFFVAHDFGLLLATPFDRLVIGPRPGLHDHAERLDPRLSAAWPAYVKLVTELAAGEMAQSAGALKLGDELVVVLLARILGSVVDGGIAPTPHGAPAE